MSKPLKPILFAVIVLAATAFVAYALNLVDSIVHGQLYYYGLQFSLQWANPYWNLLRITQILLGIIAVSTVLNTIFTIRKSASVKKPREETVSSQRPAKIVPPIMHRVEKEITPLPPQRVSTAPVAPLVVPPPAQPTPFPSDISGLIKCFHCGKLFSQPLRMLDFQGDRPRVVSICPFCNEIVTSSPRQDESEEDKKLQLRKRNNNHSPKTFASQPTS